MTQKSGTDTEIQALPQLQDFCSDDDKPYIINQLRKRLILLRHMMNSDITGGSQ